MSGDQIYEILKTVLEIVYVISPMIAIFVFVFVVMKLYSSDD